MVKSIGQIFWQFLWLGCISFGGPAAHIGYFQRTFVQELCWLNQPSYARLIALSQCLPGPSSSQIGFAIGLQRAGFFGGLAAFIGFTLPSFILMYFLATSTQAYFDQPVINGVIQGLKMLAVVVVADAVITMFRSFCQQGAAIGIALVSAAVMLLYSSMNTQILMLAIAGIVGIKWRKRSAVNDDLEEFYLPKSALRKVQLLPLWFFLGLLVVMPFVAVKAPEIKLFADFYQTGSMVFGGGHVVLPLLEETLSGAISTERFLTGYAAAQAVPGPMFTFATFLGVDLFVASPLFGALLATGAIFLPGFLLVLSLRHAWQDLLSKPVIAGAIWGINAAVVGLLAAALYQPVLVTAVDGMIDIGFVVVGIIALRFGKLPIVFLVVLFAAIGWLMA